ncbi:MAG: hypothetical protein M3680_01855 [Myxococcota bacterium]|nr:hypothetical protein [Myxococcota bacterium]
MQDITVRICRDELLGLIDTTRSVEKQRITAEMSVVVLDDLLRPEELPPEVVVTFKPQPAPLAQEPVAQPAVTAHAPVAALDTPLPRTPRRSRLARASDRFATMLSAIGLV